jgi:L-amino acid N-acyltransferase YncA
MLSRLNSKIMIKNAWPELLEQVVAIYNQAIVDGNSTADLETYLPLQKQAWFDAHDKDHPLYVALDNDLVIGWLSLTPYRPGRKAFAMVREVSIYIHRDHRSKGIAGSLLQHSIVEARIMGIECFMAIILGVNSHSIRFIENNGFVLWGKMPSLADLNGKRSDHLYYGLNL